MTDSKTDFSNLGLSDRVLSAVRGAGYDTPTPIQSKAIPAVLSGRDVVGLAQTGSGKTAAFVLPLIDQLLAENKQAPGKTARALILAPTRELASQIAESVRTYAAGTNLTCTVIFVGVKPGPQIRTMARGVDVLVATPGRLLDHAGTGALRLDHTRRVVLDEADQMLDLGFMPAIRRILKQLGSPRQTVMFSATMPQAIRKLADEFLKDPVTISATPASKPVERIVQGVMYVNSADKPTALVDLLSKEVGRKVIVFTRTKRGADRVAKRLAEFGHGANAIHGNKSQGQRERALAAFKAGKAPVLVATDIAARGIDVEAVELVVNYELPNVAESYVHRIGRTARAGAEGRAVALCAPDERKLLLDIEKLIGLRVPSLNDAPPMPRGDAAKPPKQGGGGGGRGRSGGGRPQGQKAQAGQGKGRPRNRNRGSRSSASAQG